MHSVKGKTGRSVIEIRVIPNRDKPPGGVAAHAGSLYALAMGIPSARRFLQGGHESAGADRKYGQKHQQARGANSVPDANKFQKPPF